MQLVEVVIPCPRNDPVSGLRIFRSAERAGLKLERGVFTRGRSPYRYLDALKANLFFVRQRAGRDGRARRALSCRARAARSHRPAAACRGSAHCVRRRRLLFSDEAERVFQRDGLDAFYAPRDCTP